MNRTMSHTILMSMLGGLVLSTSAWGQGDDKFKMMDSNNDGMVSAQEHAAGVQARFNKMDANHDGNVTAAEMDAGHKMMMKDDKGMRGHDMSGKAMGSTGMGHGMSSADMMKKIDSNGDGMLSTAEHAAGAQAMFDKMDANHDGNVTAAEMDTGHAAMMKGHMDNAKDMDKDDNGDK